MTQNLKQQPWGLVINKYYRQMCSENRAFKVIEGLLVSVVVVQDLEAIRDIMITQFDSFPDRGFYVNPRDALSVNLARLDYDLWKPLRQKMSPSFTPAKIRYMYPTLQRVAKQFVEVLKDECQRLANQIEIYDLCARYTTDFIGNVVFGLECNSLHEPNTEFRIEGDKAFYQIRKPYLDLFAIKFSKLMRFFNVRAFDKQSNDFFTRVFKESMELRIKSNERRNDLMDLLVDLKREHEHDQEMPLTLEILVGQVFAFFIG
uniref:Cytochrome P450 n=1 Tax=Stomoxys calcitrans TaxID=35570 RepID=A0A1I8P608_STOCA